MMKYNRYKRIIAGITVALVVTAMAYVWLIISIIKWILN